MSDSPALHKAAIGSMLQDWRKYIIYIGFVVIFMIFSVTLFDKGFLTVNNVLNIVRQTAPIAIMAVAMTFVLAAGEIDLSIGMVVGLASLTTAMAIDIGGLPLGILAGLATGLVVGIINGLLTTRVGIPSFLATLAMMGIARGTAMWLTQTKSVKIMDDTYNAVFGGGDLFGIPSLLYWLAIAGAIGHVVLKKTTFGRRVLATGGSETAARYSGVNTASIKMRVLIISSITACFAGMLDAGRYTTGRFQLGEGDELSVIAAVVLGGTSLFGGAGTVIGSIVGALMIGLINNGLLLMQMELSQQLIVRGIIIILAVALSPARK